MTERERLMKIFDRLYYQQGNDVLCFTDNETETLVDWLLENNVIVPPCKVGDAVYYIGSVKNENGKFVDTIRRQKVKQISTNSHGTFLVVDYCNTLNCEDVDVTIFFKRKEAEKALAERNER